MENNNLVNNENASSSSGLVAFSKTDALLLHSLNKSVSMAIHSLNTLIGEITDKRDILEELNRGLEIFEREKAKVGEALSKIDEEGGEVNMFAKMMTSSSIKINTFADDSDSHIAEMIIEGDNMAVTEINKTLNELRASSSIPAVTLAEGILASVEQMTDKMKKYL